MAERDDSYAKYSENQMEEEEDNVRTVNCLRGRLFAERMASRNAREEADRLGKKLIELENLLKEEAKSRKRAEKKLKFLMKRVESMNISQSSVSSTASSRTKELERNGNQESMENNKSLEQNDSQLSSLSSSSSFEVNLGEMGSRGNPISSKVPRILVQNVQENRRIEDSLTSSGEPHSEDPRNYNDSAIHDQRVESCTEEGLKHEDDEDAPENHMDKWMALVPVDIPQENDPESIDPEVLDATVKEVLEALRHAKEQLQISMQRRRMNMIRVG